MANGSLTTMSGGEGGFARTSFGLMPSTASSRCRRGFYTTGTPVCNKATSGERDRRGEILFLDARQMGRKISRIQIELTDEEIERIASTHHRWRGTQELEYEGGRSAIGRL